MDGQHHGYADRHRSTTYILILRPKYGSIKLILAKVTDELLFAGDKLEMDTYLKDISRRFNIIQAIIDAPIEFNGCRIAQDPHVNKSMDLSENMRTINPIIITRSMRKE